MKFFISLLVVFMMLGFVSAPAMACDHNCGDCPNSGDCNHDHNDDKECDTGDCGHDGDDNNGGSGNGGGCNGGTCPI